MAEAPKSGLELIREIDQTLTATPTLWWLGHSGFIVRFANITFYIDPCFSDLEGRVRVTPAPLSGGEVRHADLILVTHGHPGHMDAGTLVPMMESSRSARLVLPRSAADAAHALGLPYARMTTTDAGLRIEYFKDNLYGRIYAAPSAHPLIDATPAGGHPYLGYLIRFGRWTVYHAGDCVAHPELASRLRPFNVNVALLPIGPRNFSVSEAAQLAADIGSTWVVPMHYGTFHDPGAEPGGEDRESAFVAHMLGHRPAQRFRVFKCGEKWTVPEE